MWGAVGTSGRQKLTPAQQILLEGERGCAAICLGKCRCEIKVTTEPGTTCGRMQTLSGVSPYLVLILLIKYNLLANKNGQHR